MNVYEVITQRILEKLEQGTVPWRKPWRGSHAAPANAVSGRPYRGINAFLLAMASFELPLWLTFRQAKSRGGSVRKGERGLPVVLWRWLDRERADGTTEKVPLIRYYTVFNVAQCDGLELPVPDEPAAFEPLRACEDALAAMPDVPPIHVGRAGAWYSPASDTIAMPDPGAFDRPESYYATLFHELTHATGHPSRLDRPAVSEPSYFGSHAYSKEELVAEMGAAFLAGQCGIDTATLDDNAAYIQGWLDVLRGDARLVVHAAAQAQRAADYLLNRTFDDDA